MLTSPAVCTIPNFDKSIRLLTYDQSAFPGEPFTYAIDPQSGVTRVTTHLTRNASPPLRAARLPTGEGSPRSWIAQGIFPNALFGPASRFGRTASPLLSPPVISQAGPGYQEQKEHHSQQAIRPLVERTTAEEDRVVVMTGGPAGKADLKPNGMLNSRKLVG